jgi:hypothetical protein
MVIARQVHWWNPRTWLAFAFWELQTMFAAMSNDGLSGWKAAVVIATAEFLAIFAVADAVSVRVGRRLIDGYLIYVVGFAVATLNLRAAIGANNPSKRYCTEFESYSAPIRIGGAIAVVLLVISAIIAAGHFGAAVSHLPR